jgi:hypothetical protein
MAIVRARHARFARLIHAIIAVRRARALRSPAAPHRGIFERVAEWRSSAHATLVSRG